MELSSHPVIISIPAIGFRLSGRQIRRAHFEATVSAIAQRGGLVGCSSSIEGKPKIAMTRFIHQHLLMVLIHSLTRTIPDSSL